MGQPGSRSTTTGFRNHGDSLASTYGWVLNGFPRLTDTTTISRSRAGILADVMELSVSIGVSRECKLTEIAWIILHMISMVAEDKLDARNVGAPAPRQAYPPSRARVRLQAPVTGWRFDAVVTTAALVIAAQARLTGAAAGNVY
jgi:hypothetical protein